MKRILATLFLASFAAGLLAQGAPQGNPPSKVHLFPARGQAHLAARVGLGNLRYHTGGTVIPVAKVVDIFWGPSFSDVTSPDSTYAQTLIAFRNQYGTTPEYNTITQYSQVVSGVTTFISLSNLALGTADWFDNSTPPQNVTDAIVQGEVQKYLQTHVVDYNTIYEVFIPSSSYSSMGSSTSCGGPSLSYCAYHSFYGSGATAVKYSIQPYPSCSGCQVSGWTAVQNQEHFVSHETREAVTDQQLNAWYDLLGYEADDKCAWSPTPFIGTGGYAYQYEWSNATRSCVKTR
jgi:hypothetical protein